MYKSEIFSAEELIEHAIKLSEIEDIPEFDLALDNALTIYLNSKPGTWRLISHSVVNTNIKFQFHYFVWKTGE